MSEFLIVLLITIIAVAGFMLGLSITLIRKGHHIKSEISDNENLRKLGIKCAAQQMREEEMALRGDDSFLDGCSSCGDCSPSGGHECG